MAAFVLPEALTDYAKKVGRGDEGEVKIRWDDDDGERDGGERVER